MALLAALLAGLAAMPAPADASGLEARVGTLVTSLATAEPRELRALEAVVGPLHRDTRSFAEAIGPIRRQRVSPAVSAIEVAFAIDIYHQDPQKVDDPRLREYRIDFDGGRPAAEKALETALGSAPVTLEHGGRPVQRFGRFYLRDRGQGFSLAWYEREPDFAVAKPSANETQAVTAKLTALLAAPPTRVRLEQLFGPFSDGPLGDVAAGTGWKLTVSRKGGARPESIQFAFRPSLPAEPILAALKVGDPAVIAPDVHMVLRRIADLAGPRRFRVEGYTVDLSADPHGLEVTKESYPGSLVWRGALRLTGLRLDAGR
jgi:hypothetical protein